MKFTNVIMRLKKGYLILTNCKFMQIQNWYNDYQAGFFVSHIFKSFCRKQIHWIAVMWLWWRKLYSMQIYVIQLHFYKALRNVDLYRKCVNKPALRFQQYRHTWGNNRQTHFLYPLIEGQESTLEEMTKAACDLQTCTGINTTVLTTKFLCALLIFILLCKLNCDMFGTLR